MDMEAQTPLSVVSPVLENAVFVIPDRWENSSSVLFNYMKEPSFLELILKNQAIIPRYVPEPLSYLNIPELESIAFPMTCFCDTPFSKVQGHINRYGKYGIALDKNEMIKSGRVQPIHYMTPESPLTRDFREAFPIAYGFQKRLNKDMKKLPDYLLSTLLYMKPVSGIANFNGKAVNYAYQDDREWRYIPSDNFPKSLPFILLPPNITDKSQRAYSDALVNHPETWLYFEWDHVKYLIVPDETASQKLIQTIRSLSIEESVKYTLISRIEIVNQFQEDI